MNNTSKWFEFMNLAQAVLLQGQAIDNHKPSIQIAIEPSFASSYFLQLVMHEDKVYWYRTTWQMLIDAPKFSDPIESLQYIGQPMKPTILYENGIIEKESMHAIVECIQTISVKSRMDKQRVIILDGINYTLKISVANTEITYKWNLLPDDWAELHILTNLLEKLNLELQ